MKTICLVSHSPSVSLELKKQLNMVFGKYAKVVSWAMDAEEKPPARVDVYVASMASVYREMRGKLPPDACMVKARRFFNPVFFPRLLALAHGTRVMISSRSRASSLLSLKTLRQFGITHLDYVIQDPLHPVPESEGIRIAVAAGENSAIPDYIQQVVDIGVKDLAISTYLDIMKILDIPQSAVDEVLIQYFTQLFDVTCKYYHSERMIHSILQRVDDGIFTIDEAGRIGLCNASASNLFPGAGLAEGKPVSHIFPKLRLPLPLPAEFALYDEVVEREGQLYIINIESLGEGKAGAVVMVKPANRVRQLDGIVRQELRLSKNKPKSGFKDILTEDPGMRDVISLAGKFAQTRLAVLLEGESGVGKELFAQAIHMASPRAHNPFVAINLAAMPESLAESELFGYVEGAFTGARKGGQRGLFEEADQGTIFLDEVGDAPLTLQAKLLRVLEEGEVRHVGGKTSLAVNVRIVAATNRSLISMVHEGTFRSDLFFRLCACPLHIPPLRERPADILLLTAHYSRQMRGTPLKLDSGLEAFLTSYAWPGNVRELQNVVGYLVNMLPRNTRASRSHLPQYLVQNTLPHSTALNRGPAVSPPSPVQAPPIYRGDRELFTLWTLRLKAQYRLELSLSILRCLYEGWAGKSSGRGAIQNALLRRGMGGSLYELRKCIDILHDAAFLNIGKTRQGCTLTSLGESFLRSLSVREHSYFLEQ